ncbi:MAG: AmmeMemoRadiSam system protein B [Candidatus Erginobacter occultus]|nr:AmmeMemoRadiSam system protein B [Candidatus Erginobacter occultus]
MNLDLIWQSKPFRVGFLFYLFLLPLVACSGQESVSAGKKPEGKIRPPAVAGQFYPGDPAELGRMVDGLLGETEAAPGKGELIAVIAPHAGYVFSGRTAAESLSLLRGKGFRNVLLIGSAHREGYPGVSVFDGAGYRTPLGVVPVNRELADWLRDRDNSFTYVEAAHRAEHSLEVELPLLQRLLGDFSVVPILVGRADPATVEKLGAALAEAIRKNPGTVIVCSTDLSHYPPEKSAREIDRRTLEAVASLDPDRVRTACRHPAPGPVPGLSTAMCGEEAVIATLTAANLLGAERGEIIHYSNSADSPYGDSNRVVGYGAVAVWGPPPTEGKEETEMSEEKKIEEGMSPAARQRLLKIAREALTEVVNGRPLPAEPIDHPELQGHQGAFVTLKRGEALRGCIGQFTADQPLYRVVREMAQTSALRDPRFPPVRPEELDGLTVEISVLSPMRRISDPLKEVELGKHGIYIKRGFQTGTYLPQVATEHHMSKEEFLSSCTAGKAGLPPDAWKDPATEVYVYTAEVFSEGG